MLKSKLRTGFLFMMALSAITMVVSTPQKVQAAPFTCTTGFYQIIAGQLKILDAQTGTYTPVGPVSADTPNAAGYNVQDNYIYAMGGGSILGHLLRYEADGTYTDLGIPAGLPAQAYVAGDFDDDGNLWVRQFSASTALWKIDVSANTATLFTASSTLFVSELVYLNGFLYGVNGASFVRINTTTGVVSSHNLTGPASDATTFEAFGAGWRTVDNRLYFSRNSNGFIYEIKDYTSASPVSVLVLEGEIPTSNDGAACPTATSAITDLSAANKSEVTIQDSTLSVPASRGVLNASTGRGVMLRSYTQPAHGTVVIQPDGSYVYTPAQSYVGPDSFTYTIEDEFGNLATATVLITVNPLTATASLADTGSSVLMWLGISSLLIMVSIYTGVSTLRRPNTP